MADPTTESREQDAGAAHALWLELKTRVGMQALHYRSGQEESAAVSIHKLFPATRDLLARYPKARRFEQVALRLLNRTLRPHTSRWHGWMRVVPGSRDADGQPIQEFRDERIRRKFREELRRLGEQLTVYTDVLDTLRSGEDSDGLLDRLPDVASPAAVPLGSTRLSIRCEVRLCEAGVDGVSERDVAPEIESVERQYIQKRRAALGLAGPSGGDAGVLHAPTGLALSGGGIRSATFCLGVLQTLYRKGLFRQFDYVSSVSGGGYLASFLSCFLGSESDAVRPGNAPAQRDRERAEARLKDAFEAVTGEATESTAFRHLRNSSKYLLNGGGWAKARIAGLLVTGFLASLLMLLTVPVAVVWGLVGLEEVGYYDAAASVVCTVLAGVLAIGWLVMLVVQRGAHGAAPGSDAAKLRANIEQFTLAVAVLTIGFGAVLAVPAIVGGYESLRDAVFEGTGIADTGGGESVLIGLASVAPIVLAWVVKNQRGWLHKVAKLLFLASGPLFFALSFLIFASHLGLGSSTDPWHRGWALGITVALTVWVWTFVNINSFAPHHYYRNRLCECYLAVRRVREGSTHQKTWVVEQVQRLMRGAASPVGDVETLQKLPLTELGRNYAAPYHLINATLNAESSANHGLRGRNGDFFVFSRYYCGSPLTGYIKTADLEKTDPHVDLGTAMAISGAAASTNMGWKTLRQFRFFMTLFNVRLGYWMRRPGTRSNVRYFEGPGPVYFLRELIGSVHERSSYVNLSDGGHLENLAAYELLRRQARFIVCVDAGMEPGMECTDLIRLQRYAAIDFGIELDFDLRDLAPMVDGRSRAYAVLVKIDYEPWADPGAGGERKLGWMVYIKLALTGGEPMYVLDYRRENPAFPHETTGDQFYDEAQFEAYRALGEHAAESLFCPELTPGGEPDSIEAWFQGLADNLLPDNDPAFMRAAPPD